MDYVFPGVSVHVDHRNSIDQLVATIPHPAAHLDLLVSSGRDWTYYGSDWII